MGYQEIKNLISDIDEFHNEAELREILQPSTSDQTAK